MADAQVLRAMCNLALGDESDLTEEDVFRFIGTTISDERRRLWIDAWNSIRALASYLEDTTDDR